MSPRVFAVQQPTGRDPDTGLVRPTMNLNPAFEWGELHFILRDTENPFSDIDATARKVLSVLEVEEFCDKDWLLLVGNPALIGVVSAVAADHVGCLRMLQWSRADRRYLPLEVQMPALAHKGGRG